MLFSFFVDFLIPYLRILMKQFFLLLNIFAPVQICLVKGIEFDIILKAVVCHIFTLAVFLLSFKAFSLLCVCPSVCLSHCLLFHLQNFRVFNDFSGSMCLFRKQKESFFYTKLFYWTDFLVQIFQLKRK